MVSGILFIAFANFFPLQNFPTYGISSLQLTFLFRAYSSTSTSSPSLTLALLLAPSAEELAYKKDTWT